MRLFVTGAAGFLGRAVVASALERGHSVSALVRPASDVKSLPVHSELSIVRGDLRSPRGLAEAVRGHDVAIHLAASKSGDLHAQLASSLRGTEVLVDALSEAGVERLVAASSFSVYDYRRIRQWSRLDESSPLEGRPGDRDDYGQAKLWQERYLTRVQAEGRLAVGLLRPGVIYGRDNLWNARLGFPMGSRWWVRLGAFARVPLTYVENCAEAFVLAAETAAIDGLVVNVVDDGPPTQRSFIRRLRAAQGKTVRVLPVPLFMARLAAHTARLVSRLAFGPRGRLPGILVPAKLEARVKPLRYDNGRLKEVLGWKQRYSLEEALGRSVENPHD